jgi:acyl-CoA thioester hydrolase
MAASQGKEESNGDLPMPAIDAVVVMVAVRWADLDVLGHANQSAYHEYLEEARTRVLAKAGDSRGFVLARVELDYLSEIGLGVDRVEVAARVVEVGRSSVRIEHEVRLPDGAVAARGASVLVAWDQQRRAKRELDEEERRRLRTGG